MWLINKLYLLLAKKVKSSNLLKWNRCKTFFKLNFILVSLVLFYNSTRSSGQNNKITPKTWIT